MHNNIPYILYIIALSKGLAMHDYDKSYYCYISRLLTPTYYCIYIPIYLCAYHLGILVSLNLLNSIYICLKLLMLRC